MRRRSFLLCASLSSIGGCLGRTRNTELVQPPSEFPNVEWARTFEGDVERFRHMDENRDPLIATSPLITEYGLIVGTQAGDLFSLDPSSGDVRWHVELPKPVYRYRSSSSNQLYVWTGQIHITGRTEVELHQFDMESGDKRWTHDYGNGSPFYGIERQLIICGSSSDELVNHGYNTTAVDIGDGRESWSVDTGVTIDGALSTDTAYLVAPNILTAIRITDGQVRWRLENDSGWTSVAISADESVLYATDTDERVVGLDPETGDTMWEVEGVTKLYTSDGLYISGTDTLARVNRSGDIVWRRGESGSIQRGPDDEGTIFGRLGGDIVGLDFETGQTKWRTDSSKTPTCEQDSVVYCTHRNTGISALNSTDGERLWEWSITEFHGPEVGTDFVFVGTYDGNVFARRS